MCVCNNFKLKYNFNYENVLQLVVLNLIIISSLGKQMTDFKKYTYFGLIPQTNLMSFDLKNF